MQTAKQLVEAQVQSVEARGLPEMCSTLRDLRDLKRSIAVLDDHLSDLIAQEMGGKWAEVEGFGIVEVKKGSTRKAWDHDRLTSVVVARAIDERTLDEETGEYEREATAVARALRDCAGFSYWKIGGLKKRGIDPEDYCETSPGRVSVVLP